jgi:precorrin-3B synthase
MTSASMTQRAEVDRCPGVLRPHRAADGALLRLRLPGGELGAPTLDIVSRAAARYADGAVQLTSRANLQLRGVATDDRGAVHPGLVDEIVRAGLLPHPRHERVRNILCSPLTGRRGGHADLRPLLRELDDRLCSTEQLAGLPGPFLFVLDDGRGDVMSKAGDLGVVATDTRTARLVLGGLPIGPATPIARAAEALIELALRFLDLAPGGPGRWHVRDLPGGGGDLLPDAQGQPLAEPPLSARPAPSLWVRSNRMTGACWSRRWPRSDCSPASNRRPWFGRPSAAPASWSSHRGAG